MKPSKEVYWNYNLKLRQIKEIVDRKKAEKRATENDTKKSSIQEDINKLTAEADAIVHNALQQGINLNNG